jgi:hypothetical protein
MINRPPRIFATSVVVFPVPDIRERASMIRAARAMSPAARKITVSLSLLALLPVLAACAGGNATSNLAPSAASPAPTSAAAAPAPAAAPAEPAQHLTSTEINEKCWMRTEKFKADDLDKRMKLVNKCVDEMTRAQGGA